LRLAATATFRRDYRKLPPEIRDKVDRQLKALLKDPGHPSLRAKKIKGATGIWEGRVDRSYRFTFSVSEGELFLRRVGPHDRTLGKP
jgi:mRNA-degrading endonuclease RelE of RelBE toxin-antitoxin system